MLGILPACECLESADLPCHRTDLRLVVDLDVALDHRLLKGADDVTAEVQRLLHGRVELRPCEVVGVLDAVAGDLCAVHDERNIHDLPARTIDARLDLHRQPQIVDTNPLVNELDGVGVVFSIGRDGKVIVVEARDKLPLECLAQKIGDVAQETVALLKAVPLVKALKVLDVKVDECQRLRQVILQMDGCMAHKLHHVEEACDLTEITFSIIFQQNEPPISSRRIRLGNR